MFNWLEARSIKASGYPEGPRENDIFLDLDHLDEGVHYIYLDDKWTRLQLGGDVYGTIRKERARQDAEWGGPGHDDQHNSHDWVAFITKHAGMAVMWPFRPSVFRYQMVRVAALAVAAIEWFDRQRFKE